MNTQRTQAQRKYEAALSVWNVAAAGRDQDAFDAADAALTIARNEAIAAEAEFPTVKESRRAANLLRLRNRGLDV